MIAIAHRHGVPTLVDGAQSVSRMRTDVQALDADFFVWSGHKMFAPTGIGVVYGKQALLDAMPPWQGGGNMIVDVTFERTVYQPAPGRSRRALAISLTPSASAPRSTIWTPSAWRRSRATNMS
jgi:cysteine desulfurase/selenocysteine lyase